MELVRCVACKDDTCCMCWLRIGGMFPALRLAAGVLADAFQQAAASAGSWLCREAGGQQGAAEGSSTELDQEAELAWLAQQAVPAVEVLKAFDDFFEDAAQEGKLDPEPYLCISSAAAEVGALPLPFDGCWVVARVQACPAACGRMLGHWLGRRAEQLAATADQPSLPPLPSLLCSCCASCRPLLPASWPACQPPCTAALLAALRWRLTSSTASSTLCRMRKRAGGR